MSNTVTSGNQEINLEDVNRNLEYNIQENSLLGISRDDFHIAKEFGEWDKRIIDYETKIIINSELPNKIKNLESYKDNLEQEAAPTLDQRVIELSLLVKSIVQETASYKFGELPQSIVSTMLDIESELATLTSSYRYTIMSSENSLEHEVYQMIESAEKGLPPKTPYYPKDWETVASFIESTYGKYLKSCGAVDDCMFLDNLRAIHPDSSKLSKLRASIRDEKNPTQKKNLQSKLDHLAEKINTKDWGSDVVMALYNHFRDKGGAKALTNFIKKKSDRGAKERKVLEQNPHVARVAPKASSAYLKRQYLINTKK